MVRHWHYLLLGYLVLLSPGMWLKAQHRKMQFDHICLKDGLPHSVVAKIIQDKEGFLWFATGNGLARYDGYDFTVYRPDASDPYSIKDANIRNVVQDKAGNLWIATAFEGLNKFDRYREQFTRVNYWGKDQGDRGRPIITSLMADTEGNVWIGTNQGLYCRTPQASKTIRYLSASGWKPSTKTGREICG
ncbi:MAG: hypothetical protein HC880_04740 [Bacteroidia bacterium]|nr:hypothetical protein [Bacteroidia bacterium]